VLGDEAISPPSSWNDEVPPALDAAVMGALERDAGRRTGSAQDLATALAAVLLRLTRSPEDADLRAFMQRLFEPEIAAAVAAPLEATRVRPVAIAAEPVAGERMPEEDAREGATRTVAASPPRRPRSRRRIAAGIAIAAGAAAAVVGSVAARRVATTASPSAATSTTATPPPTPTATPPPPPTASPPPTPTASPTASHGARETRPPVPNPARPLEATPELNALRLPPRASGQGILSVNAVPWGIVRVNGFAVGETPQEMRLPAGRHRVRIERSGQRAVEEVVAVKAGARTMLLR
jgi:serine/threonine-protein kinase